MVFGDKVNWEFESHTSPETLLTNVDEDLLTLEQVKTLTQLSQAAIYDNASKQRFPAPIKVGGANRWIRAEIVEYLLQRVLERNARLAQKKNPGVDSTGA